MVQTVTRRLQIDPLNPLGTQPSQIRDFAWTFDSAPSNQSGVFFNGRNWIMDSGTLHNTARSPEQMGSGAGIIHGTQKNVRGNAAKQGVDGRVDPSIFDATLGVGGTGVSIPLVAGDCLVTTLSRASTGFAWRAWPGPLPPGSLDRPGCTDSAAVIHVVNAVPAADAFAPPWGGNPSDRTNFSLTFSQVRQNLLPRMVLPNWAGAAVPPSYDDLLFWLQTEWLDLMYSWDATATEGWSNAPNYGQLRANIMSQAGLMICLHQDPLDPLYPKQQLLLKHFMQHAIDYWYLQKDGKRHDSNGGHTMGRKSTVIAGGILLNDPLMSNPIGAAVQANTGSSATPTGHWFQEDTAHYDDPSLGPNWKGGPGYWRYNLDDAPANTTNMDAAQFAGYQHINPSGWGAVAVGQVGIGFHEGNSYYAANHEEKVGQTVLMLCMKAIDNWNGQITHTIGKRNVIAHTGTPGDLSYSASLAYFTDMARFMSPHVPEIDNALTATAPQSCGFQKQGSSSVWTVSGSHASTQFARDMWYANVARLGQADGWIAVTDVVGSFGPELPIGAVRGALDRPLLWTKDFATSGATVVFQIWSGLTALNLPANVSVQSTHLMLGFPAVLPVIVSSPLGGQNFYLWYGGVGGALQPGQVPAQQPDVGPPVGFSDTTLTNIAATNGWTTATVVLPTAQTVQTWYCFQVIFNLSDGTKRATNALLCLI